MLKVFAPAKVNLHLHVTGKRDDGYHTLDSLVMFADIGDLLSFHKSDTFSFTVDGPFSSAFLRDELDSSPQSKNIVVRAAWKLAHLVARELNVALHLQKNLPLGGGIGGGSADAAACLWGLCQYWQLSLPDSHKIALASQLGSDVPVCLASETCQMQGTGDILRPMPPLPELPVLMVWPGEPVATAPIFQSLALTRFSEKVAFPQQGLDQPDSLCAFLLTQTHNDLTGAAEEFVPAIRLALEKLGAQPGCRLARMSGSGSTCFGIFASEDESMAAARALSLAHPTWWVRAGWLNRVSRY